MPYFYPKPSTEVGLPVYFPWFFEILYSLEESYGTRELSFSLLSTATLNNFRFIHLLLSARIFTLKPKSKPSRAALCDFRLDIDST